MACCAEVRSLVFAALLLAAPLPARAQAGPAAHGIATRVAQAVASRWGVDASAVHVQPASEREAWPRTDAEFRVQSASADGTFVLSFDDDAVRTLVVRAGLSSSAPVAARDLNRGDTIAPADIALQPSIAWGPPRPPGPSVADGWIVRRRITQGEPLRTPAVAPPLAVRPGQEVRVILVRAGITIALNGRAAGQAGIGERVAVRADTGRRLEGVATAPGVVTIEAPGREQP